MLFLKVNSLAKKHCKMKIWNTMNTKKGRKQCKTFMHMHLGYGKNRTTPKLASEKIRKKNLKMLHMQIDWYCWKPKSNKNHNRIMLWQKQIIEKKRSNKSVLLTKIVHWRRKQSLAMSKHCQTSFWRTKFVEKKEGFSINEIKDVIVMSQRKRWRLMSQATNTKENEKHLSY